MRKTNSKEVKKYFDEYLNDILTDNFDGNIDLMAKQFVASCCDGEGKLYRKYNCYQEAFKQMVWDYATPYYQDMKEMLMEALEQTEKEADKYSNTEIENKFSYLVYCAYLRRCEKDNINAFQFK